MFFNAFSARRNTLPLIPLNEQKINVNQLILMLIPVIKEMRLTAKSEPIPDKAEIENAFTK